MNRLGLALSGGGFRATLYHLGVVRYLRDAGILSKVTHINTVSGGSILGAHLALNWDRYCGSPEEFDAAAGEVIDFVQMDVRNRIVRRFPFASTVNMVRSLFRMKPVRQLTRPGLLEKHYQNFLYGDIPLSQLPARPRLNILSTNLSEGCLCSFNNNGFLLQRRLPGRRDRFDKIEMGLATVPMAVAASSAFPGFFPPLELNGWEVGADEGEFDRQAFTDGAVYDNLGLRMFRFIEQAGIRDSAPLVREDFLELEDTMTALGTADGLPPSTPLYRLRKILDSHHGGNIFGQRAEDSDQCTERLVRGLWEIIRTEELFRYECFNNVELSDPTAQTQFKFIVETNRTPELDTRTWLNRHIIEAALSQVIGKPCIRMSKTEFDGILVSDAGGKFKVSRDMRGGGLVRTALRSSDILMDRVWQLELETFENTPGILFFTITDIVEPVQDSAAMHPEVQRQTAKIRTDLDRFSDLEISSLIRHGYCIARKMCRTQGGFLKADVHAGEPWDPTASPTAEPPATASLQVPVSREAMALRTARQLQGSIRRKIWSTLFSFSDWPSYVWIALLVLLFVTVPYSYFEMVERAERQQLVLTAIAEMSPDYHRLLNLLEEGPNPEFETMPFEEVETLADPDLTGYEVLSDTRIFDMRAWSEQRRHRPAISYARLRVRRTAESGDNTHVRIQKTTYDDQVSIHCLSHGLNPTLSRMKLEDGRSKWELDLDFSHVPIGSATQIVMRNRLLREMASTAEDSGRYTFGVASPTGLLEVWMLMPEDRDYNTFEVSSYPIGKASLAQVVVPHSRVEVAQGSIATFRLVNPEVNHLYECHWTWKQPNPR